MVNRLADGMSHLTNRMRSHAGIDVVYRRDAQTVSLVATQGITENFLENTDGSMLASRTDDFLITRVELTFNGIDVVLPKRGDTIEYTRDGILRRFITVSPFGENCYALVDQDQAYRIHTEEIEGG